MPRNSLPPFLKKLRNITQDLDEKVACWSSDGKSYEIHDLDEFKKLLKEHFKGKSSLGDSPLLSFCYLLRNL